MDQQRLFSKNQKTHLLWSQHGQCGVCNKYIFNEVFHAHHVNHYANGGLTNLSNALAVCVSCHRDLHRKKGMLRNKYKTRTGHEARKWQREAVITAGSESRVNIEAAPGAGKTFFGGFFLDEKIEENTFVLVVAPSKNVQSNWRDDLTTEFNIQMTNKWKGEYLGADFQGAVVCYQSLNVKILGFVKMHKEAGRKFILILDEVHHGSDENEWGSNVAALWDMSDIGVTLTGTPFRTDSRKIPGLNYKQDPTNPSREILDPTYTYTYSKAIVDNVCRRVAFQFVDGNATYKPHGSDEVITTLISDADRKPDDDDELPVTGSAVARTIYENNSVHSRELILEAVKTLDELRRIKPDAAALFVCRPSNKGSNGEERNVSAVSNMIYSITGEKPVVVTADDDGSQERLARFKNSSSKYLVAINMVAEGVNVPRLQVACLLRYVQSEMLFRQLFGPGRIGRQTPNMPPEEGKIILSALPLHDKYAKQILADVNRGVKERGQRIIGPGPGGGESDHLSISDTGYLSDLVVGGSSYGSNEAVNLRYLQIQMEQRIGLPVPLEYCKGFLEVTSTKDQEKEEVFIDVEKQIELDSTLLKKKIHQVTIHANLTHPEVWNHLNRLAGAKSKHHAVEKFGATILKQYIDNAETMLADARRQA